MRASVGGWLLKSDISPARKRLDDEHVRCRGVRVERHLLRHRLDLAQRIGQPVRVARDAARRRRRRRTPATAISPSGSASRRSARGSSSPAARSGCCRHRDRPGRRSPEQPGVHAPSAPTIMIAAAIVAATELIRMSRFLTWASSWAITPSSSGSLSTRRIPSVAATAACCGIAPGRERVRRRIRNDVHLRHRQARPAGQPLHDPVERVLGTDLLRAIHPQDDLVREPVRPHVHDGGKYERRREAAGPARTSPRPSSRALRLPSSNAVFNPLGMTLFYPLRLNGKMCDSVENLSNKNPWRRLEIPDLSRRRSAAPLGNSL